MTSRIAVARRGRGELLRGHARLHIGSAADFLSGNRCL